MALTKTLATESGEEKLTVSIPNCLVKTYQVEPWGASHDVTEIEGEHIPPASGAYTYKHLLNDRSKLASDTKQKEEPSDRGLVFLH